MEHETIDQALAISEKSLAGKLVPTVDARRVWRWLEVGRDFTDWIKYRIEQYDFLCGLDYTVLRIGANSQAAESPPVVVLTEYYVTLGMAKELCMVERNERGRLARRHFIAAEEELAKIKATDLIQKTFLLPHYDHDAEPLYPAILFEELFRVWGFAAPKGSKHNPACRGIVHRDINGILPISVQDILFDIVENPYYADGTTRMERHWRRITEEQRRQVLRPRIDTVIETCMRCPDNDRMKYKRDLAIYDRRHGIVLRLSPKVRLRLGPSSEDQLLLFD